MSYKRLSEEEDVYYEARRSTLIEDMPEDVKQLFEHVKRGETEKVNKMLNSNININHVDMKGNSILHIALKQNNTQMVKTLLKVNKLDVGDCLFHAIKLNQLQHVQLIREKLEKVDRRYPYMPCENSPEFPHYLTPLMLAAQCGHVEIINYFMDIGHPKIPVPHEPQCLCDKCVMVLQDKDPLELAHKNLEIYKALCSPAYLMKVSDDPVLMVFYRVHELKVMAFANRVFIRKYEELIEKTELIAAKLVALCWTSDEVRLLLRVQEGSNLKGDFPFPRLILAVDLEQRYFVSQVNIQAVLEDAWTGNWYRWKSYSNKRCLLHVFGRILMLPFLYIICIFFPLHSLARFYSIPVNRMLSSVASYFFFLFLLYLESDKDKAEQRRYDILENKTNKILILVFVLSHIASSFRMWMLRGTERFFAFAWNLFDIATQVMFLLTFAFWISAFATLYMVPDIERKYWDRLDPQLLAEGFFCIGTVMAYMRLLLLIQIDSTLGPMQVSLGRMTKDFKHFVIIFAIVIGSFLAGMCRLYEYYDGMKQIDPDSHTEVRQESSFVSPYDTFKVLFWGLFGMSSQESGTVVIENIPSDSTDLESINTHDFTQAVGNTLFSGYIVLTVIVLLNMLIAAISNTFQSVAENVDHEWVFGRTKVYLIYMAQTVLPPPLSILPTFVGESAIKSFFKKTFAKSAPEEEKVLPEEMVIEEKYKDLMKELIKRYFSQVEEENKLNADERT